MEPELADWLASDNGAVVHTAIFTSLILGGLGFPIPEDIPIALAGVAAAKKIISLQSAFATCYCGVLIADQIVYFAGYFFGNRLLSAGAKSSFLPSFSQEKVERTREALRRKRLFYIFLGRHLFPVRTLTFLMAGALRIPFLEFLAADAIAAFVSVSLIMGLGWYLGETLTPEVVSHIVHRANYYIGGLCLLILLLYAAKVYYGKKKENRLQQSRPDS